MSFFRKNPLPHIPNDEPTDAEIRDAFITWARADQPCRAWCSRESSGEPKCPDDINDTCWLEQIIRRMPYDPDPAA